MSNDENDDANALHLVLINDEEQYSLWPAEVAVPNGWRQVLGPERKDACLKYVEEHWTDMRPLSLRKQMGAAKRSG